MAKGHNCDKGAEFPRTPDSALRIVLPIPRTGHFDTTIKQMQIAVFPIATEEVEVIAALARLVWQAAYADLISQSQIDYMLEQRYNAPRMREELCTPGIWWDKAMAGGEIVGFASSLLQTPEEMKLDKLYVDPARQRAGIGACLAEHVAARAAALGCRSLILAVNRGNVRAKAAYEKYGFTVREERKSDIGGGFVMDDFIMAKPLA